MKKTPDFDSQLNLTKPVPAHRKKQENSFSPMRNSRLSQTLPVKVENVDAIDDMIDLRVANPIHHIKKEVQD